MSGLSRYIGDIVAFQLSTKAKAVYCFAVDGKYGTGGCPLVQPGTSPAQYRARCEELIVLLRRSADFLQADIDRQVPIAPPGESQ